MPRGTLRQAQGRHSLAARGSSVLVEDGRGGAAARRAPGQGAARLAGQRLGVRGSGWARLAASEDSGAAALGWLAASEDRGAAAALPGPTAGEGAGGVPRRHTELPLRHRAGTSSMRPAAARWKSTPPVNR